MRHHKISLHYLIYDACLRHPVKARITALALLLLVLFAGVRQVLHYRAYKATLANAAALLQETDAIVLQATAFQDELQQIRNGTQARQKLPREVELEQLLSEYQRDIDARFNTALSGFAGIYKLYRKKADTLQGEVECLSDRINFSIMLQRYQTAGRQLDRLKQLLEIWSVDVPSEVIAFAADAERRIKGQGSLTIHGVTNIVEAIVFPYDEFEDTARFSLADAVGRSSSFPLKVAPAWSGSYLVWMTNRQKSYVPYPVFLERSQNLEVQLELPASIPKGMLFVPGGRFFYGGEDSSFFRMHERTLPSFFIKKHEVTVAEYLKFWTSLTDAGLRDDFMSRIRFSTESDEAVNAWNKEGKLQDDRLILGYPVVGISLQAAQAYCEWLSDQRGAKVRLPTAEEWEKAARGVDGRRYVWGNGLDVSLTLTQSNTKGKAKYPLWAPPGKFPSDISVYNVLDMAGNVREMTSSLLPNSLEQYQLKGGSAFTSEDLLPCSSSSHGSAVPSDVGFRYVQELPE